jgi:Tol biopolymer transport system component
MDLEPAMAPDGSYLVFVSNRPVRPGGKLLDGTFGGKTHPGRGGNLWRVERIGDGWATPVRLPDIVNTSSSTYAPAVAADGSLYFMHPDPQTGHFRLYASRFAGGQFAPPQPLPFSDGLASDVDPAVAPDQSFLVFTSNRAPSPAGQGDLFVVFATPTGWGPPVHLGPSGDEARLDPACSALYFTAADDHIHRMPIAHWLAEHANVKP